MAQAPFASQGRVPAHPNGWRPSGRAVAKRSTFVGFAYFGLMYLLTTGAPDKTFTFAVFPIVWSPTTSIVVAVLLTALQVAACVNIFRYRGHVERLGAAYAKTGTELNEEAKGADLQKLHFGVSTLSLVLIALTTVCAVCSPLGLYGLIALAYLWDILIVKLVLNSTKRAKRCNSVKAFDPNAAAIARGAATSQFSEFLPSGYAVSLIVGCTWLIYAIVVATFLLIALLGESATLQSVFFWLCIVAATGTALSLVREDSSRSGSPAC